MKERNSFDPIGSIKASLKTWLLPHPFKIVGQVLILATLIALAAQIFINHSVPTDGYVSMDSATNVDFLRRVVTAVLYLSIFLITCSREKDEDEMTAALRGETLKEIGYLMMLVYVAYRIVMAIFSEKMLYITHDESLFTPFLIWLLYYGLFERKMRNLRRQSRKFNL